MKHIVAGTAGHIDHGKTALVRALTGIDTDRLEEEKRRGISIDLGFAHLQLTPAIRLALVDVPGHERFIKNMLAGAAGIDFVVLVVSADESIMPQTREHFEICRLLKIQSGVVALTKADLVDPGLLDLVRLEVEEFLSESPLATARIIPVSSTTATGLDELRAEMVRLCEAIQPKDSLQPFRMPIDRAFAMKGFGSVVTGTVIGGFLEIEQEVAVYPVGLRARVRGIQVHGATATSARAGQRAAVNLAGLEVGQLGRGQVLGAPGTFRETRIIDTEFELLKGAPPLKHRAPVHLNAGTAEAQARALLLDASTQLEPGNVGFVRFLLNEPLLLLPTDRFIVRRFSPVETIGGGSVLDIDPPLKTRRPKRVDRLRVLASSSPGARIELLVREAEAGMSLHDLRTRTGYTESAIRQNAASLIAADGAAPWFVDPEWMSAAAAEVQTLLADFHKTHPIAPGISKEDLRTRIAPGAPPPVFDAVLERERRIVTTGETVHLRSHSVALKGEEEAALNRIEDTFRRAGLLAPPVAEVLASSRIDEGRSKALLQILLKGRRLIRVSQDLIFHPEAMSHLKELVSARKGERFGVPDFKNWTGISRKYAIPLLEFLDREKITRREGDVRVVL